MLPERKVRQVAQVLPASQVNLESRDSRDNPDFKVNLDRLASKDHPVELDCKECRVTLALLDSPVNLDSLSRQREELPVRRDPLELQDFPVLLAHVVRVEILVRLAAWDQ